jgi:hypothetical protein
MHRQMYPIPSMSFKVVHSMVSVLIFALWHRRLTVQAGWGGSGYNTCAELLGPEFERVFYKNRFAQSTATLNLYMIYGGEYFPPRTASLVFTKENFQAQTGVASLIRVYTLPTTM